LLTKENPKDVDKRLLQSRNKS